MTKISLLLFLFLCSNLTIAQEQADTSERQDLTLEIIPSKYGMSNNDTSRIVLSVEGWHFHVLLTNNSIDTICIWSEYLYSNLYFEIEYPDGTKTTSYKWYPGISDWGPIPISIPPNGYYIFDVNFNIDSSNLDGYWSNSILNEALVKKKWKTKIPCKIKAVYKNEIKGRFGRTIEEIWTGVVESKMDDYIVVYYQYDKQIESKKQPKKMSKREKKQ